MSRNDEGDRWLSEVDLETILSMFRGNDATEVLYKVLPRNANSKNQVYLGGHDLSQFGKIPSGEMTAHLSTSEKNGKHEAVFQASLRFYWLDQQGTPWLAPEAKLIFYPQYPEVRFSGFLKGCKRAPSTLWSKEKRGQEPGRILIMGIGRGKDILAVTLPPESPAARQIRASEPHESYGIFGILPMPGGGPTEGYRELVDRLSRIHQKSWVPSTRLDKQGRLVPCNASNCNGNTLESLLGIRSNGYSLPDFHGWEIKARQVTDADKPGASTVTLFTPEPTSGVYVDPGFEEFMRRHGYIDTKGRVDRLNFGGIYRVGTQANPRTGLRLILDGFDAETGACAPTGSVQLIDSKGLVAAAWPFIKLMDHWKSKHAHAAFVPSQQRLMPQRQYRYGRRVLLCEGAKFERLLKAINQGLVYYDPGIKLENASGPIPKPKKRSQFRVASKHLAALYESSCIVDVCEEADRLITKK
jgi:hypothetical protein